MDDAHFMTVAEVAARWRCSAAKVRAMLADGTIRCFRHGNVIRISAAVIAAIESPVAAPTPTPTPTPAPNFEAIERAAILRESVARKGPVADKPSGPSRGSQIARQLRAEARLNNIIQPKPVAESSEIACAKGCADDTVTS